MSSEHQSFPPPPPIEPPVEQVDELDESEELSGEVKAWLVAAHLLPLCAYALYWIPGSAAILAAPLAIRRFRGGLHPLIADQALEAFQFQIVAAALTFLFGITRIGWALAWVVVAASAVLALLAAARACDGERYRYPWIPRLLE
jgi:uncharacterized Tic20 family protein